MCAFYRNCTTGFRIRRLSRPVPLVLWAGVILFILYGTAYGSDQEKGAAARFSRNPDQEIESLTRDRLKEIETRLDSRIREMNRQPLWRDGKWSRVLRTQLINLGMWGGLQPVTARILTAVGDDPRIRKVFFFAMPFFRWMSEPFVFPVNTDVPPSELSRETDRIVKFIAAKEKSGMKVSLDNVGDASLSERDAKNYLDFYLQMMRRLGNRPEISGINFSLKLSALVYRLNVIENVKDIGPHLTPGELKKIHEIEERILTLLKEAAKAGGKRIFIRLDMEEYAYKPVTLALFRDIVERNPSLVKNHDGSLRLGVVIQAYLRDSWKDLADLVEWGRAMGVRVPVRIVKGAYLKHEREVAKEKGEPKSPVWDVKASTDASFENLCEFMILNGEHIEPAFATHNLRSMAHVMALAQYYGISGKDLEFQVLYGMGDEIKEVVKEMDYPVLVYVPAGSYARGLKYAGRRFSELANKENALSRSLQGDFSHLEGEAPSFQGTRDLADGKNVISLVLRARNAFSKRSRPLSRSLGKKRPLDLN